MTHPIPDKEKKTREPTEREKRDKSQKEVALTLVFSTTDDSFDEDGIGSSDSLCEEPSS
jgi:hypothetical protein